VSFVPFDRTPQRTNLHVIKMRNNFYFLLGTFIYKYNSRFQKEKHVLISLHDGNKYIAREQLISPSILQRMSPNKNVKWRVTSHAKNILA